jgi:hypothetical protein
MWQQDAYRMIQRRTRGTGIKTRIGNHTFRATGITAYLKNNGALENPRSTSTTTRACGRPSSTAGDRMRFRSMRSSELRSSRLLSAPGVGLAPQR